jgi:hypothetical protein
MNWKECLFFKPDLDTTLTAIIAGVKNTTPLRCTPKATLSELFDPEVLCIEVGGSGLVQFNNFDHHDLTQELPPACVQAFKVFQPKNKHIEIVVNYVSLVDMGKNLEQTFPSLSHVFSGMLLSLNDPVTQFKEGLKILDTIIEKAINPYGPIQINEWRAFVEAKEKNNLELEKDKQKVVCFFTKSNYLAGFLETVRIGGFGYLYHLGCNIGILYNPEIRKFTIASQGIDLSDILEKISTLESGWGGRKEIIGSPYNGSKLSPQEIIEIVKGL